MRYSAVCAPMNRAYSGTGEQDLLFRDLTRCLSRSLAALVLVYAGLTSAALAQSVSMVDENLSILVPAVQVESDFYNVVLVPVGEQWQVASADTIAQPQLISGRAIGEQLTLLCLSYEGALYQADLSLVDPESEIILFNVLNVVELSDSTACDNGIAPDPVTSESTFNPDLLFTKYEVSDALTRGALCNDGSNAAFYYRPSQTNSNSWKIHLQGGGSCSTEEDCQTRTMVTAEIVANNPEFDSSSEFLPYTSSNEYPDTLDAEGIFSLDLALNPVFGEFNHVYIPYCSSDSHYGDKDASDETFDFHFKGTTIIQSVFEDLLDSSIIGETNLQNSDMVVISGTSAGGRGVQQNLDRLAAMIPHSNVHGVLDSSYFTRYFLTEEERVGLALRESDLWNGQYDDSCMEFLTVESKHLCDRVELMFDYIETPIFVHMDQLDETALGPNTDQSAEFATHTREELQSLCGAFSGQFGFHGAIRDDEAFFQSTVSGLSYHDVLVNWLFGDETTIKTAIMDGPVLACTP